VCCALAVLVVAGRSDGAEMTITILSPREGDVVMAGDTLYIQWTTENLPRVVLRYSLDGGRSTEMIYGYTLGDDDERWGNFPWIVPDTASDQCMIIIHEYMRNDPYEVSGTFSIVAGPTAAAHRELRLDHVRERLTPADLFTLQGRVVSATLARLPEPGQRTAAWRTRGMGSGRYVGVLRSPQGWSATGTVTLGGYRSTGRSP
jgi:hypothetical protein